VDAEIISLDAFNRSQTVGVVAVAFVKVTCFKCAFVTYCALISW